MPTRLDVGDLVRRGEIALGFEEHPNEMAVRLRQESRATLIDHCKDVAIFVALYLFLITMVLICIYFLLIASSVSPETLRWSQSILTAILSGSVSFLVGRKIGGK
jgi:hypothetical protein